MYCTLRSVIDVLMLRCSFVSVSVCKQDTLGSVFWVTMLRSLWSCAWLGSMDAGPSPTILPCGPGRPLHSSTRQECNVAWPRDFPSFWNEIWSLYPEILLGRKVKLSEKCKEISWFEKPASASSVAHLTHFFGRNFDPRRKSPGIGWWHRGKNWFWCSFSGKNPRDYTSLQSKWSEESLFIAYIRVSKGMLWCLKYAWSVWIESRV